MSENAGAIYDGFSAVDAGVNTQSNHSVTSQINPNGLARNQCANAINCTFRGGLGVTHRPPYMLRQLQFPNTDVLNAFGSVGVFQGFSVHEAEESLLLVSVSGRTFTVDVDDSFNVAEITIAGDPNPTFIDFAWFVQAGPFSVIQDSSSVPLIFDGTTLRRAEEFEIKPGTCMAYSQGRIWYAVKDKNDRVTRFRATDLIGGPAGTPYYNYQDSVLMETENTFLNEGGDFSARSDMGEIRAMVIPRMLDTSLGQGPLQVFSQRGAISVNAPVDRTQWKNVTYPILTESQLDYGTLGSRFATNVNGDVIYRSVEGFNSFKLARADFQTWINTPISNEVDEIIASDVEQYLFYGSSVLFDSRVLGTTMPRPTPGGMVHDGLVALDTNLVSTLRNRAAPAWEGLWTGISILQINKGTFGGVERCFAFARNTEGRIELWEILPSFTDEIWDNGTVPIVWSFETPSYDFDSPQDLKSLQTAAIWTSDVQENVEYVMQWRPDQHPCYLDWHAWSDCAPIKQCSVERCGTIRNLKPQYRPKVRLPQPPDSCNSVNLSIYRQGYEFQFRTQVTGHTVIRKIRFASQPLPEPFYEGCPLVGACLPLECCSPDPLVYSSAPYHNSGSSGGYNPYPILSYPPPPHDYPYPEYPPCVECGIINPPSIPPTPVVPPTTTFPGLPPVILIPDPNLPPITGGFVFFGSWVNPASSVGLEAASITEPPDGLADGILAEWSTSLWQQFSDYVVANAITVTQCQIVTFFAGADIGPGASRRWFASNLFENEVYISSFGLGWVLAIVYL